MGSVQAGKTGRLYIDITGDDDPWKIHLRTGFPYSRILQLNGLKIGQDLSRLPQGRRIWLTSPTAPLVNREAGLRALEECSILLAAERECVVPPCNMAAAYAAMHASIARGVRNGGVNNVQRDEHGRFYVELTSSDNPWKVHMRTGVSYDTILQQNPGVDMLNLPEGHRVYLS